MHDINKFNVMQTKCASCPFREENAGTGLVETVRARMFETSQICHHPRLSGKPETQICRGARDEQLTFFHRIGFLEDETDAAWNKKREELSNAPNKK